MAQQNKNEQQVDVNQLLKVRREKLADLQERGKDPFQITKYDVTNHTTEIKDNFEKFECEHDEEGKLVKDPAKLVSIAGRIMLKRVMGKASFCNVQDKTGNIQVYVARNELGDEPFEEYKDFKKMDIGDIVGVKGYPFVTKTGEKSIHATEVTLLSKSLQILPEKHHGLTNTDLRYRQRYLDLIMNPEVKETFIKRSKIISEIRKYLDGQGFMEVETPMLVHNAGGAAARPFETHFNALDEDVKLRISLELYLKSAGTKKCSGQSGGEGTPAGCGRWKDQCHFQGSEALNRRSTQMHRSDRKAESETPGRVWGKTQRLCGSGYYFPER